MNTIIINGNRYTGNSVSVINNKVFIDGVDQTPNAKQITIGIEGNIENLTVDYADSITVTGDVGRVKSGSGNVTCRNVGTDGVTTGSGNVEVGNSVLGDVKTGSGNVKSNTIAGSAKTMSGNIKYNK